jgi:hypothetical protein
MLNVLVDVEPSEQKLAVKKKMGQKTPTGKQNTRLN